MKSAPLKAFVCWLEQAYSKGGPCGSAFEQPVPPELVMKLDAALTWTLATQAPVNVFTGPISAEAVLAALVLRRSRLHLRDILQNRLEEANFERLAHCLGEIRQSGLELEGGPPPEAERRAAFLGGPLLAVVKPQPQQYEGMTERQAQIMMLWDVIEREDEDISTERLLAATAERSGVNQEEVVEALNAEHRQKMSARDAGQGSSPRPWSGTLPPPVDAP